MRKVVAVFLMGAFVLLLLPVWEFAAVTPEGSGALAGRIFNEDMRTPVRDAVVKLRNVTTLKEYVSEPTDTEGMYRSPRSRKAAMSWASRRPPVLTISTTAS